MKHFPIRKAAGYSATALAFAILAACGDDDSFSPMAKDRGYDYAYTSAKDLSKTPCNEMRDGREAVIGKNKERYECEFDYQDSVYLWVGYDDTLTAEGLEYHRTESSSSLDDEDSSSSSNGDSRDNSSSSSTGSSSSSVSSSSSYSSSSSSVGSSSSSISSSSAKSSSSISSSSYSSSSVSSSSVSSSSISSSSSSSVKSSSSVSSSSVSSSSISSKEDLFNPNLTYGTMTDPRDGKKYKTIVFNGQTWMAENLNFADSSIVPLLKGNSLCYQEKASECELFGRLYNREAAMNNSKCAFGSYCDLDNGPVQGICPDGWHVMTSTEANDMISYVGRDNADKIMSANGWDSGIYGTNTYGLSFIAPGERDGGNYDSKGVYGYYWMYIASTGQYYLFIKGVDGSMKTSYATYQELYFPVRCIADAPASSSSSSSSLSSSSAKSSSSSAPPSSSSIDPSSSFSKSDLFNPDITYGEMTDSRDGKIYRTIDFAGSTWMAENLNYADSSKNPLLKGNSRCYDDDPNECEIFGRLYAHPAAMNDAQCGYTSSCNLGSGHIQGICPDGWHIPTKKEAEVLESRLASNDGKTAKSSYGWEASYRGTNTSGLSFTGSVMASPPAWLA